MPEFNPPRFKPGDVLTAKLVNDINAALRQASTIRVGSGLSVRRGAGGPALAVIPPAAAVVVGTADDDIPPRSGTSCGTGSITIQEIDADGEITEGGSVDVVNPSSTEMSSGVGIAEGVYCIAYRIGSVWVACPLECEP